MCCAIHSSSLSARMELRSGISKSNDSNLGKMEEESKDRVNDNLFVSKMVDSILLPPSLLLLSLLLPQKLLMLKRGGIPTVFNGEVKHAGSKIIPLPILEVDDEDETLGLIGVLSAGMIIR